jgi:hypothetical protein
MLCHDMLAVLEVYECPELWIRPEDDVTSTAAVTSVRTSLRNIFLSSHMSRACTAVA